MKKNTVHSASAAGFTLLECLVCIAIIAIFAAMALPAFSSSVQSGTLEEAAGSMLASVARARSEAIKQTRPIKIIPINAQDWASGWCVLPATGADCSDDSVLAVYALEATKLHISLTPASGELQFQSDGTRLQNGAVPLEFRACSANDSGRTISIAVSGSTQYSKISSACVES